ncbi:hypothetical protein [Streptomyces sp. DSM 40484]|uniref:hypothetical protein n=1 Tax=Streptomyces kroppenstedtii TaxID=3051181 RepID=UPI0028D34E56|nr:hypothetical protein [Streptomyces sp. DSM 40484]
MPTSHESTDVPAWPVYDLTVHDDGRVVASGPLISTSGHATRASAIEIVADAAARLGRAVRATATEPGGVIWPLIVAPDGEVSEVPVDRSQTTKLTRRQARRKARAAAAAERSAPRPGARPETETYAEPMAEVRNHLEEGRADRASTLATLLDEQATGALGVSHPETLRIREVRARAAALAGDRIGGIQLYRDVAERWYYQREAEQAEAVANSAELLWRGITDVEEALSAGVAVIRMRGLVPGRAGEALAAVLAHRERLLDAQEKRAPERREHPVTVPPGPRVQRPAPIWERPAVNARRSG